jgi:peptide subunit release factor 1 (eRF1)
VATATSPDRDTLRRLAELRVPSGAVLSVYVNLDPREFATPEARSSAIGSVVDEAGRKVRDESAGLGHDARKALREDVDRVKEYLRAADFAGTRGVAIFTSGADLFETLHLPHPVDNHAELAEAPVLEPLVGLGPQDGWAVVLANRRETRIFRGGRGGMLEIERFSDDVPGRHDQGGWSQARYQRSIDEEATRHLRRTAEALGRRYRRSRFDHLLIGAPEEAYAELADLLESELRERLCGRIGIDVENSSADDVLKAAGPGIQEQEERRQGELLTRLQKGLGRGERAAAGLEDVLGVLNEQRVEALLVDALLTAPGVECPQCGWICSEPVEVCPADGAALEQRPNVVECAVERALLQDAEVVVLRERPEMEPHGGIAAVLRF